MSAPRGPISFGTAVGLLSALSSLASELPPAKTLKTADKSRVEFRLPYTLGTHRGDSSQVLSEVKLAEQGDLISAVFTLSVEALKTGNSKLDCHLWESLALDYQQSSFPNSHVCTSNDRLPSEGKDSARFKEIRLELGTIPKITGLTEVTGTWTIHGVSRKVTFPVKVSVQDSIFRVQSTFKLKLSDFGIQVKNFLFITVAQEAEVTVDLNLAPQ